MDRLAAVFEQIATGTLLALDLVGTFVFALNGDNDDTDTAL
jgi:hypothetical protein